jgi:hypothetical protein
MRTEEEVLKDFEKLGYEVDNDEIALELYLHEEIGFIINNVEIFISKRKKRYIVRNLNDTSQSIGMEEHKLLNELFAIWGWIENDR